MGDQKCVRSSEELWRELLEAAGVVARDVDALAERGVNVWENPKLHTLAQKVLMHRPKLADKPQGEQLVMTGFRVQAEGQAHPLKRLQEAVREGEAEKEFPVGMLIADTWTDTMTGVIYAAPLRVVDYRKVELASGDLKPAAVLLRTMTTPFRVCFDQVDARHCYGYNRLSASDMLLWLNSDARRGNWWYAQHDEDVEPDFAREKGGYLAGCSLELQEVLSEIVLRIPVEEALPQVCDKVVCKVFLPKPEDLNIDLTGSNLPRCSGAWRYFLDTPTHPDTPCSKRVCLDDEGEAQRYWTLWTRPNIYHNHLWMIAPDGSADFSNAAAAYAVVTGVVVA